MRTRDRIKILRDAIADLESKLFEQSKSSKNIYECIIGLKKYLKEEIEASKK